jgi:hypothetical protein
MDFVPAGSPGPRLAAWRMEVFTIAVTTIGRCSLSCAQDEGSGFTGSFLLDPARRQPRRRALWDTRQRDRGPGEGRAARLARPLRGSRRPGPSEVLGWRAVVAAPGTGGRQVKNCALVAAHVLGVVGSSLLVGAADGRGALDLRRERGQARRDAARRACGRVGGVSDCRAGGRPFVAGVLFALLAALLAVRAWTDRKFFLKLDEAAKRTPASSS